MDGNRRWARKENLTANEGHLAGYNTILEVAEWCRSKGIKIISIYAFSMENKKRNKLEIKGIIDLFKIGIIDNLNRFIKEGVKLNIIGKRDDLPLAVKKLISMAELKTKDGKESVINVAFNYSGRSEIINSVKEIESSKESLTEENLSRHLYTKGLADPDLIIRTGGQKRLSNFMLWQSAYSEFYFTDCLWPDFDKSELQKALNFYSETKRNFGA
jgi:undecaprenyl diphosphate synthase